MGWLGRPGARDMREPDCERAWFGANCDPPGCMLGMELWRFMAEEGIGIAVELLVTGPRVCAQCEKVLSTVEWEGSRAVPTYLAGSAD